MISDSEIFSFKTEENMVNRKKVLNIFQYLYLKMLEKRTDWNKEHYFPGKGKFADKKFYIIRRSGMKIGLFSIFNTNLARIDYAVQKGMIPVIDMQNFRNSYHEEGDFLYINAWEKFFEQPTVYSLKDAYAGKTILLSDAGVPDERPNDSMDFFDNVDGIQTYWNKKCKEYIRLKPHVLEHLQQKYNNLFDKNDRVLGILARGTDYVKLRPSKHPIQPTASQLIEKAKEVMEEYNCNKIFLATEDKDIAQIFAVEFGNACVTNSSDYVDYKDGYLSEIRSVKENDKYIRGLNYLLNILILAKSNCIVAGRTSGTVGAALFTEGWEYSYFFDLGYYE